MVGQNITSVNFSKIFNSMNVFLIDVTLFAGFQVFAFHASVMQPNSGKVFATAEAVEFGFGLF